ncbi:MAG: helix-turn-helix transcriptional regulator, partial [Clostridia bacterium]|nr:helix-turn-helix transcriptional regulator [Clostridia bacterium]
MEFKEKLKKARNEQKISQQALADAIFVSRSAVAKWESGLGMPCNESMEALEKYFGVEKNYFLTDMPDEVIVKKNIKMHKVKAVFCILTSASIITLSVLLVASICLIVPVLEETSLLYTESVAVSGFGIGVNRIAKVCYAAEYECSAYTERLGITIPDEYDGVPVKRIGGFYGRGLPQPFSLSCAELYMNAPEDSKYASVFSGEYLQYVDDEFSVVDIPVVLNIGENIETIDYVDMNK